MIRDFWNSCALFVSCYSLYLKKKKIWAALGGSVGGSFQTQLFLRAVDSLLDNRYLCQMASLSTVKFKMKEKKRVRSAILAVLSVVQISSAEEQAHWILTFRSEVLKTNHTHSNQPKLSGCCWMKSRAQDYTKKPRISLEGLYTCDSLLITLSPSPPTSPHPHSFDSTHALGRLSSLPM